MYKSYFSEDRRLSISISEPEETISGKAEIWAELEGYGERRGKEPTLRLDVSGTRYGAHVVFSRDEALSCSSGQVTEQFLKDIRLMESLYAFFLGHLSLSAAALFDTFEAQKAYFAFA